MLRYRRERLTAPRAKEPEMMRPQRDAGTPPRKRYAQRAAPQSTKIDRGIRFFKA